MYLQDSSSQDVSLIATEAGREGERRQGGREREEERGREGEREEERWRGDREEERGREGGAEREGGREGGRERERSRKREGEREERRETRSTTIVQPQGPITWLLCRQSQRGSGMIQLEGEPRFLQTATETNGLILFAQRYNRYGITMCRYMYIVL